MPYYKDPTNPDPMPTEDPPVGGAWVKYKNKWMAVPEEDKDDEERIAEGYRRWHESQQVQIFAPTTAEERQETRRKGIQEASREFLEMPDLVINPTKEVSDFGARFDLAKSPETYSQVLKLEDKNYKTFVGRDENWKPIPLVMDPNGEFHTVDISGEHASALAEVADVMGSMVVSSETGLALTATLASNGAALPYAMLAVGGAGAVGAVIDRLLEQVRGYEEPDALEALGAGVTAGVVGAITEPIGRPIPRVYEVKKGLARLPVLKQAQERVSATMQFAREWDLPMATPATLPGMAKSLVSQAGRLAARARYAASDKLNDIYRGIGKFGDEFSEGANPDLLDTDALIQIDKQFRGEVQSALKRGDLGYAEVDNMIIHGIAVQDKYMAATTKRLLNNIKKLSKNENAYFDVADSRQLAQDRLFGIWSAADPIDEADWIKTGGIQSKELRTALERLARMDPEIRNREVPKREGLIPTLGHAEDTDVTWEHMDPFDQMQSLRTTFYNLMTPGPNGYNYDNKVAGELWHSLTGDMLLPTGGTAKQNVELGKAVEAFNTHYRTSMELRESVAGRILLSGGDIGQFTARILNNSEELLDSSFAFLDQLPDKGKGAATKQAIKDMYWNKMLDEPRRIGTRLRQFKDPANKRLLLSEGEEEFLKSYQRAMVSWERGPVGKLIQREAREGSRAVELLDKADERGLRMMVDTVGRGSPEHLALKRGVITRILEKSMFAAPGSEKAGGRIVDPQAVLHELIRLNGGVPFVKDSKIVNGKVVFETDARGVLGIIFDEQDLSRLAGLENYLSYWEGIARATGGGEGIQAAEMSNQMINFSRAGFLRAGWKAKKLSMVAHMLQNEDIAKVVMGIEKPKPGYRKFRAASRSTVNTFGMMLDQMYKKTESDAVAIYGPKAEPMPERVEQHPLIENMTEIRRWLSPITPGEIQSMQSNQAIAESAIRDFDQVNPEPLPIPSIGR